MTKEELAAKLNGREYRNEVDRQTAADAKAAGLVIVHGASDDLAEFDGAIRDETGAYGGKTIMVDRAGLVGSFDEIDHDDEDEMRAFFKREGGGVAIKAIWSQPGYSWTYETAIPHATFEVVEDGKPYCRGIVFALADLPT